MSAEVSSNLLRSELVVAALACIIAVANYFFSAEVAQ